MAGSDETTYCGGYDDPGERSARDRILRTVAQSQPMPAGGSGPSMWDAVVDDMRARDQVGFERYHQPLQACDGRDSLADAYQEALDKIVYWRQYLEERAIALRLLDAIIRDTQTMGSDYGMPHVAELAQAAKAVLAGQPLPKTLAQFADAARPRI